LSRSIRVALDVPLRVGDVALTFSAGAAPEARRGDAVIVPVGHRLMPGIVLGDDEWRADLKPVLASAGAALIPHAVVDLAEWVATEYLSSVGEALAVATPWDALWARLRIGAASPAAFEPLSRRPVSLTRAAHLLRPSWTALEALAQSAALTTEWLPAKPPDPVRDTPSAISPAADPAGSGRVRVVDGAVADALGGGPRRLLVAGWHRTPGYLAAIRRAQTAGWSVAAIFPSVETALIFADAARLAGIEPIVLHGDLDPSQRLAAWRSAIGAKGAVVVGTRSAVFAPLPDPLLLIVDDEDASGHKEERAPRYLTRGVADARCAAAGVLVVGSTTPTVVSYVEAQRGQMRLVALPSPRPRIGVVDLRRRRDADGPISPPVLDAVRGTIRRRGRAVLVVDRKGYAALQCHDCGAAVLCEVCGVPMRYERDRRRLRCRICGRTGGAPDACARCGGTHFLPVGTGTERAAAAMRRLTVNVWRLDRDTVPPRHEIAAQLEPFRAKGGVLVATPLVLPWLEAIQPDLVAIVAADRWLHRPEYRAAERALVLLRSVGSAVKTPILVETADPTHPAVVAAQSASLRPFYADELALREALGYPPARSLLVLTVRSRTPGAADTLAADLARAAPPGAEVLGPVPRLGPGVRAAAHIVIKAVDRQAARALVFPVLTGRGAPRGTQITADVDPIEL